MVSKSEMGGVHKGQSWSQEHGPFSKCSGQTRRWFMKQIHAAGRFGIENVWVFSSNGPKWLCASLD